MFFGRLLFVYYLFQSCNLHLCGFFEMLYTGLSLRAQIELPDERDVLCAEEQAERLEAMQARLRSKFPVDQFVQLKNVLDPEAILSNEIVDQLFKK